MKICTDCKGYGCEECDRTGLMEVKECHACEGTGEVVTHWDRGDWLNPPEPLHLAECPACNGEGEIFDHESQWSERDAVDYLRDEYEARKSQVGA